MPSFNSTDKVKITTLLGYQYMNSIGEFSNTVQLLNEFLNRSFEESYITEVRNTILAIEKVETNLDNLSSSSTITKADVVEFNTGSGYVLLQRRGASLINRLGSLIGTKPLFNRYSTSSKNSVLRD